MRIDFKKQKRVTFYTLLGLFLGLCVLKLCLLSALMAEDYDSFASSEAMFIAFAGIPTLLSAAGAITIDLRSGEKRLLSWTAMGAMALFVALTLLELIEPLFYYMGAASALCGIACAGLIVWDFISREKRRAEFVRREAAKRDAQTVIKSEKLQNRRKTVVKNEKHDKKSK